MTKVKLFTKIVLITIVTVFLTVCITAGVLLLMDYFAPEKFMTCYDFGEDLYAAIRYYCWHYIPSEKWIEYKKVKYVQRYLRNEKVKRIAFGKWEIVEPEKINQVLNLINSARKGNIFTNTSIVWLGRMTIITDKHKFIIPVQVCDDTVYGLDWTSEELRKQIWKWGYDNNKVYKYDLQPKEQVVAVLVYQKEYLPPLALFGDKKMAEKILFEIRVLKDLDNPIRRGDADLYNSSRLRQFRVKSRREGSKYIFDKDLEPKHIFEGRDWLEKIMDAYEEALKEAEAREGYFPYFPLRLYEHHAGKIVFMTEEKDYWKEIGIDANTVFDNYIKSEKLKDYFDELGLTKELLAGEPNAVRHPQADEADR